MAAIVIFNEALDARAVIDTDALPEHELRGWAAVGPISDRSRDPLRTDAEQAEFDAAEAARIEAILNPQPAAATPRRPRKS